MLKISQAVEEILYSSETALSAFSRGFLNYSAYAQTIKKQVEEKTLKSVKIGSITVALSRLSKKVEKQKELVPKVKINDLTVKSSLVEITYDKTVGSTSLIKELYKDVHLTSSDFLEITQGSGEITIIASENLKKTILKVFLRHKPKAQIANLVALTVKFDQKYINEPNVLYALLRTLALKRINIVELVSTYTELTFIIKQEELEKSFATLNKIFQKI